MSYFDRIQRCFAKVIGEHHANQMTPDSTMEEVKQWDSLNFVGLIMAVEDEFKIQLTTLEAATLTSVLAIEQYLQERLDE
jgi:acyl carrier protein